MDEKIHGDLLNTNNVLLGFINTINFMDIVTLERFCEMQVRDQFFGSWALYLSFGTCYEVNIMQLCSFSIYK